MRFRVRILGMQSYLGSGFNVRVRARLRFRVSFPCGDIDSDCEVWSSSSRATFRVMLLVRCMGRK